MVEPLGTQYPAVFIETRFDELELVEVRRPRGDNPDMIVRKDIFVPKKVMDATRDVEGCADTGKFARPVTEGDVSYVECMSPSFCSSQRYNGKTTCIHWFPEALDCLETGRFVREYSDKDDVYCAFDGSCPLQDRNGSIRCTHWNPKRYMSDIEIARKQLAAI